MTKQKKSSFVDALSDIFIVACIFVVLVFGCAVIIAVVSHLSNDSDYYTFTNYADGSDVYIRKDCICTVTTVSGAVYVVPTNGQSVRVKENMDEVTDIVGIH